MESIEGRPINNSGLVADQHSFRIVEGVYYDGPGVSEADLEDWSSVFAPPWFTDCGMIIPEGKQVTGDGQSSGYFWDAFNVWDICRGWDLKKC
jgi:hypothetical protein